MDATLRAWTDFDVAMLGATAALAGLVIVAASVNIGAIVKEASLVARLGAAIAGLLAALIGCAVGLMPAASAVGYGLALIAIGAATGVFAAQATRRVFQNRTPQNRARPAKAGILFATPAAYLCAGALLLAGAAEAGLTAAAVGAIVAIVVGLIVSWVVLVEVLR